MGGRRLRGIVVTLAMAAGACLLCSAAATASPAWRIDALSNTTAAPGGTLDYLVQVTNVGDADSDGGELDLVAALPAGVTAVSTANASAGSSFSCTGPGGSAVAGASTVTCAETDIVPAHGFRTLRLTVAIDPSATGSETSSFQVSGGGAPSASTVDLTTITPTSPPFGIRAFDGQVAADPAGDLLTQAAGHPFAASTEIDLDTTTNPNPPFGPLWPVEPAKDLLVDLPGGFVANPIDASQCTATLLANAPGGEPEPLCPPSSQVGTVLVRMNDLPGPVVLGPLPLFSMVPAPGEPARFGFDVAGTVVTLDARLRSGADYGLTLDAADVPQSLPVAGMSLTLWGVPADPSHDPERACPGQLDPWRGGPTCASGALLKAFLRNPTSCTGAGLPTTLKADSWTDPGAFVSTAFLSHLPPAYPSPPSGWGAPVGLTGCAAVPFDPSAAATPASTAQAGQPVAFAFDVSLPQSADPAVLAEADLKGAVFALPEGMRVSPVEANGFAGCSPAQIDLHTPAEPTCPDASRVGSVTMATPLLSQQLTGSAYLATPDDNPFGSALALYLVAEGPGLIVKLPWEVQANPVTGRLTATFDDFPQLPLANLSLQLSGGPHGWMALPDACGTFTTHALATSWSGRVVALRSSFAVSQGAGGGRCPIPTPPPFPLSPASGGAPGPPASSPGPAAPSPPAPPGASVASVGGTRVENAAVLVPLACSGGSGCSIVATLSVVERVRKHRHGTKVVMVGRASTRVAAGQRKTLSVGLNRLGRALLRRSGRLRATLRVTQGGKVVKLSRVRLG
ncbi:MAG TPA: hypothetical protein VFU94_04120 [Conexibacter sp.]|nr:hypothetical protein [Conexibacter sp.]